MYMFNSLEWIKIKLIALAKFLKAYIYPLATCFFAILNYSKMKEILEKTQHENWSNFALILSIVYILFTLGFGIYWIYLAIRYPGKY